MHVRRGLQQDATNGKQNRNDTNSQITKCMKQIQKQNASSGEHLS